MDESDGLERLQRHRDQWRQYAYGKGPRPRDFMDSPPFNAEPTRIEELETEISLLRKTLLTADEAINPHDRGGISMEKWNVRLKAATAAIRAVLNPADDPYDRPDANGSIPHRSY